MAIKSKSVSIQNGKAKAKASVSSKSVKTPVIDESGEEWSSEDDDEENGGVSEKGMRRLMELVNEEDLDEFERAQLAEDDEEEDEEQDEEDEDEEEDEEGVSGGDDEDAAEELDSGEVDEDASMEDEEDSDEDEEEEEEDEEEDDAPLDDTILVEEADPDAVAVDDLGSDVSLDDDAVPMRKVTHHNKPALRTLTAGIKMTHLPWPEHLIVMSKETIDVDPEDDLQREMAFYKMALDQMPNARKLAAKYDIPFDRPNDYYAEMVKSDEHMERVRTKLVEEAQGIKKSEEAKRQRDLKKYGKQIQMEKLKSREMEKKSFQDRMQGVKRKRKEGMDLGDEDDEFGIAVEDAIEGRPERGGPSGRGRGRGGKSRMPRQARDAKFSLGGGGKRSKQNTRESTNDFSGWGQGGRNAKGGRGGKSGRGGGGSAKRGGAQRPGKSRRHANH